MDYLLPGDILITRNLLEEDNQSIGYWNHVSIYVGDDKIVEAQSAPYNKVIQSDLSEFFSRYPYILIIRHPEGRVAANQAIKYVGLPYRMAASVFRHLRRSRRGENCVSVVRKSYFKVYGRDPDWKSPDSLVWDALYNKQEFELEIVHEKPDDSWRGIWTE